MSFRRDIPIFREVQRISQGWVWAAVAVCAGGAWFLFVARMIFGVPLGSPPPPDALLWLLWAILGIGLPAVLLLARLVTEISPAGLVITYLPFMRRRIDLDRIEAIEPVEYRPIREYGGWGIRWMPKRGLALTIAGNRGVRLIYDGGKRLLLGSRAPDEVVDALTRAQRLT